MFKAAFLTFAVNYLAWSLWAGMEWGRHFLYQSVVLLPKLQTVMAVMVCGAIWLCRCHDSICHCWQHIDVCFIFQEIYPPKLQQFAYVTDGACTEEEILGMELIIMKVGDSSYPNFEGTVNVHTWHIGVILMQYQAVILLSHWAFSSTACKCEQP